MVCAGPVLCFIIIMSFCYPEHLLLTVCNSNTNGVRSGSHTGIRGGVVLLKSNQNINFY